MLRSAVLASSLLWVGVAAQALTPTAQDRRVEVNIHAQTLMGPLDFHEEETASDFGPFAAGVDGLPTPPFPVGQTALQDSEILPDALHATGSALASAGTGSIDMTILELPQSVFRVDFDVVASAPFVLTGLLELSLDGCDAWTSGSIRLSGPGGAIAEVTETFSGYPDAELCADLL